MRQTTKYAVYCISGLFLILGGVLSLLLLPIGLVFGGLTFLLPWGLSLRLSPSQVRR